MKKTLLGVLALCWMGAPMAHGQTKPVRLYISPDSTVAVPDVMKNLVSKCPNTTITVDPVKSDFMLQARGGSGNYKLTVFKFGGVAITAIYGATTVTLSNAVKDVCYFLQSTQTQNIGPATFPGNLRPGASSRVEGTSRQQVLHIVRDALASARGKLLKAANQSDYVREAIAQIDQALDDTQQAAAHVNDDSAAAAPTAIPNFDAAPPPSRLTNFMLYASLDSLKSAYVALNRFPDEGFGGYRALVNNDIAGVAAVLVNGIASYNAEHPQVE